MDSRALESAFTLIIPAPVISRLDPDSGFVDAEVRIHGSNFGDRTGTVTFNGLTASPDQWNDQTIRVRVPEEATTGPVVVTTAGGQSSAGVAFSVTPPPSGPIISKLEPDSGLVDTEVKIHGSNFGTSGTVTFNGTTASTTGWASDEIQTRVPATATTGLVVVTVDGEPSAGVTFTVTIPAPVISRLDPEFGTGGRQRHHRGVQFREPSSGTVTFNGTTASTTSWDSRRDSDKRARLEPPPDRWW